MALTLSQAQLSAAIRLGDSPEEVAEATRLLAYVTAAITKHLGVAFDGAPDAVVEEAAIRLGAYLFDMPNAGRGLSYANAGRNSGAWTILLPYRIHRAGNTDDAVAAAQQAIGTTGNPVTGLAITVDGKLEVIFADGATVELDLPAGMGGGVLDQTARDAAAAAQGTANNAATAATAAADIANANTGRLDAFPAGTGGVDQTARDAADGAQSTADGAQTAADGAQADLDTHEASTHNTDGTARTAAANAQSAIEDHERTTHNTDTVARNAAAAAQSAAEAAAAGRPTVLYEAATAAIGGSTGLITGNVVCPETGEIELYFDQVAGTRQGGIAYARIPAARIRAAESALNAAYSNDNVNLLAIPHGANRGIGVAVQATTNYLMLSAQAPGNFYIRIRHALT